MIALKVSKILLGKMPTKINAKETSKNFDLHWGKKNEQSSYNNSTPRKAPERFRGKTC